MPASTKGIAALIPLRDVVIFPSIVTPLFVGREKSIQALNKGMDADKKVVLVAQRSAEVDDPTQADMYEVATLATILQLLKLPDGTVKVLVEGESRVKITNLVQSGEDAVDAEYELLDAEQIPLADEYLEDAGLDLGGQTDYSEQANALMGATIAVFDQYVKLNKKVPSEVVKAVTSLDDAGRLADTVAAHLNIQLENKQDILQQLNVLVRLDQVMQAVEAELDLLQIEKKVRGRVRKQMEKGQREYYLNEQMKAIQKELGDMDEVPNEMDALAEKIKEAKMSEEALAKADTELAKLKMMSPMSAEAGVVRNYLDWLVQVPWSKRSRVRKDLNKAQEVLDAEHYGLEKVKERIVEYLAVQTRVKKMNGPILCLVGPPGVGKTSLGESIARATNREFSRIALGGVRDEAEIRGHRRTYIGAMPGKLVQKIAKTKVRNPLVLLDEIDKMASDFRGDPASALLEVLDPEQNNTFNDHYLEVDIDLSEVMFICTSNSMNIPGPLLDRMELIHLSGYTEDEKLNIATQHLLPKQVRRNGLKEKEIQVDDEVIRDIIRRYTREAGVRSLERELAKICRKVVTAILQDKETSLPVQVPADKAEEYLGVPRFRYGKAEDEDRIGQVTGLAWTEVGGELLTIEAAAMEGKGLLSHTGQLGDVMKESVQAAMTVVKSRARRLGIDAQFYKNNDIHIHVPEGATPKDGPSAGIAMCTALVSAKTGIAVKSNVAMTGEITLRGEVLPIGGLKEKLLAAHRGGITKALIPTQNVKDLADIPDNIKGLLEIVPVRWIDEVFEHALTEIPQPLPPKVEGKKASVALESVDETKASRH